MRVVTLSDHTAQQIQTAQDLRANANERLMASWRAAVDRRDAAIAEHVAALRHAWVKRRPIAVVAIFFNWLHARLSHQPTMPSLMDTSDDEGRFLGGQEGEARVLASLSQLFDHQWVVFRGYFNRGGETDLLLVGPTAIAALEVKYRNGVVHCERNRWTCDKRDRYGNVVQRGVPVQDARGRSPAQQVNDTADQLQAQLARQGHALIVRRAVILAHDASQIGRVNEPGVEFIGALVDPGFQSQLLMLVQPPPGRPDLNVAAIEQVIRRDHEHHTRAKAQRFQTRAVAVKHTPAPIAPTLPASAQAIVKPPMTRVLAQPRPAQLLPPSADALLAPSDLEQRQAKALREDLVALHRSQGHDVELERRVRKTISGHLQTGGRYRVLAMAIPMPGHSDEYLLLDRLIQDCRQTVELEDRTLHAIVVPLAVRWETPEGSDWSGVWLSSVRRSDLDTPARDIRRALGAEKVSFSARLYEAGRLESLDARLLRQAMMQLEAGTDPDIPELKPAVLAPSSSAGWQIVYALAVAVTAPGDPLLLKGEARRALAEQSEMLASPFNMAALEATGTPDAAQAHAEGIWPLADGIQHGRRLQRRHVLETILAAGPARGATDRSVLRCWYASDQVGLRVRLLVDWGPVRVEREFSMHGDDQPLAAFRELLDAAIAARAASGTSIQVEELDLHDYRLRAQALGMSWMGQGPAQR